MAGIFDWMKTHFKAAIIAVAACSGLAGTIAGTAISAYFGQQQSREDRFADSLMEEYKAVAESKRALYAAVDKFTLALNTGKKPDSKLVSELNDKLLDLHQRIDVFNMGLSEDDQKKVSELQNALAEIKMEAARAKSKSDLKYFAGRVALFDQAYTAARPIVERKIGLPNAIFSS